MPGPTACSEGATKRPPRILVVEDDAETRQFIVSLLRDMGMEVVSEQAVGDATATAKEGGFDLLVVDRMLPDGSGLDLVREVRNAGDGVPILVLTALKGVGERVQGLESGADDYLGKPFAPLEVRARVRALLRRGGSPRQETGSGRLRLEVKLRRAFVDGQELPLTGREFIVLDLIASAVSIRREEILQVVWGDDSPQASGSLDVILSRLRRKLHERGLGTAIETIRGRGYRWRPD